jgi:hypothetical protein
MKDMPREARIDALSALHHIFVKGVLNVERYLMTMKTGTTFWNGWTLS